MAVDKKQLMRQAIAAAMSKSKREIPHYYLETTLAMTAVLDWLTERNRTRPPTERLLYIAPLLKAVALALKEVPELNGFYVNNGFQPSEAVHVGVAIALRQGGLLAPALHDVDQKDLDRLMRELQDLVSRVRAGSVRSSELTDSTVTVTSLGEDGVEKVFGVIYPPQVALVGFGRIVESAVPEDGRIVARRVLSATLSADHRASDGHRGAQFLSAINRHLQSPEKL